MRRGSAFYRFHVSVSSLKFLQTIHFLLHSINAFRKPVIETEPSLTDTTASTFSHSEDKKFWRMDNLLVHGCALIWMSSSFYVFCGLLAKVPEESPRCRHKSLRRVSGGLLTLTFVNPFLRSLLIIPEVVIDSSFTAL